MLGRKNIHKQGSFAIEIEVDKVHSCRGEPQGSTGALLWFRFMHWWRSRKMDKTKKLNLFIDFIHIVTKVPLLVMMYSTAPTQCSWVLVQSKSALSVLCKVKVPPGAAFGPGGSLIVSMEAIWGQTVRSRFSSELQPQEDIIDKIQYCGTTVGRQCDWSGYSHEWQQ